ncbi:pantothenate synthetase [Umbelopsis sp. PMI_123]|nr:pantothenate synthetase [Umbelopsis sp. PMI_123]
MDKYNIPDGVQVFDRIADFRRWRRSILLQGQTLGYVATMGALHSGHISLAEQARRDNDHVAITIFVNPAQFAPHEDLASYPRTLQADLDRISKLPVGTVTAILVPQVDEMYPNGIELDVSKQVGAFVEIKGLSQQLEGGTRPHFFRGVATVVSKFFNIVQPDHAYFGQKDVQQCVCLKRLVEELHFPLQLHVCPTQRDTDGLALSSRNVYLTPSQRKHSTVLFKMLSDIEKSYKNGERSREKILANAMDIFHAEEKQVKALNEDWTIKLDYLSLANPKTLEEEIVNLDGGVIASVAVFVGKTRLIDNFLINCEL